MTEKSQSPSSAIFDSNYVIVIEAATDTTSMNIYRYSKEIPAYGLPKIDTFPSWHASTSHGIHALLKNMRKRSSESESEGTTNSLETRENPTAADFFGPLVSTAMANIPKDLHNTTQLLFKGTGDFGGLTTYQQNLVANASCTYLEESSPFVLSDCNKAKADPNYRVMMNPEHQSVLMWLSYNYQNECLTDETCKSATVLGLDTQRAYSAYELGPSLEKSDSAYGLTLGVAGGPNLEFEIEAESYNGVGSESIIDSIIESSPKSKFFNCVAIDAPVSGRQGSGDYEACEGDIGRAISMVKAVPNNPVAAVGDFWPSISPFMPNNDEIRLFCIRPWAHTVGEFERPHERVLHYKNGNMSTIDTLKFACVKAKTATMLLDYGFEVDRSRVRYPIRSKVDVHWSLGHALIHVLNDLDIGGPSGITRGPAVKYPKTHKLDGTNSSSFDFGYLSSSMGSNIGSSADAETPVAPLLIPFIFVLVIISFVLSGRRRQKAVRTFVFEKVEKARGLGSSIRNRIAGYESFNSV